MSTTMDSERNISDVNNENFPNHSEIPIEAWPHFWTQARQTAARIAIKAKGKILLIDPSNVMAIEAQGNYALVQETSGSHLLRESISTMEEKLNPLGFVRIHRSVLVNAAWVEEIQPKSTGEYVLRLTSKEYVVTRTYRKNLRLLAQSWIGACAFLAD
jgi:DNA-binding LytR/AlgR family response regulator